MDVTARKGASMKAVKRTKAMLGVASCAAMLVSLGVANLAAVPEAEACRA